MKCFNCDKEIGNNNTKCEFCGVDLKTEENESIKSLNKSENSGGINTMNINNLKSKKTIKTIIIIVSILAVIATIATTCIYSNKTNMNKFINKTIEFSGYNGFGEIKKEDVIDFNALISSLGEAKTNGSRTLFDELMSEFTPNTIMGLIKIDIDKSKNLSNGDTVTVVITPNYLEINKLNLKKELTGKESYTVTYKVEGLKDGTTIDPFKIITSVTYDKTENGSNKIKATFDEKYSEKIEGTDLTCSYSFDGGSGDAVKIKDSNGKEVGRIYIIGDDSDYDSAKTIKFNLKYSNNFFGEKGITVKQESISYKPEKVIDYLTDINKISDSQKKKLEELMLKNAKEYENTAQPNKAYFKYVNESNENNRESKNKYMIISTYTSKYTNSSGHLLSTASYIKVDQNNEIIFDDSNFDIYTMPCNDYQMKEIPKDSNLVKLS